MKRAAPLFLVALALACGFALPARAYDIGDTPKFELKSTDGKTISPETLKGYVVVIHFWDSTDDYTQREAATFVPEYEALMRRGVSFVGYNIDKEAKNFLRVQKEEKLSWPQVSDTRGFQSPVMNEWGITKPPPYSFILSPEGKVLWLGHTAALAGNVEEALRNTPPKLDRKTWVDLGTRQLKEILRLLEEKKDKQDYRQPLALLGTIRQPVWDDPAIQALSKKIVPYFESKKKDDQWSLATYLDSYPAGKQSLEAMKASITKPAASRPAKAADLTAAQKREASAGNRLATADLLRAAEKHPQAYRAYKHVVKMYDGTDAAKTAGEQVKKYEADEKFMAELKRLEEEQDARAMLGDAAGYRSANREDLAVTTYKKVIEKYPGTEWAKEAEKAIQK